jgi:hypothetical protein
MPDPQASLKVVASVCLIAGVVLFHEVSDQARLLS